MNLGNREDVIQLVCWIEDQKIRLFHNDDSNNLSVILGNLRSMSGYPYEVMIYIGNLKLQRYNYFHLRTVADSSLVFKYSSMPLSVV
jgi:hypothetical protein